MLALFTIFEHLSNVRRLLNRFRTRYVSPTFSTTTTTKSDEVISSDLISTTSTEQQQHDILLRPIVNNILSHNCLKNFDDDFREDLQNQDYFARELDACLLEMREIERDLFNLKQRQCYYYEKYLDFVNMKDQIIDKFLEYYDEYLLNDSNQRLITTTKELRRQSIGYEYNVPVRNRFDLLKQQHTRNVK